MPDYTHILLAVDFSPGFDPIAQRAADLARRYGARLSLIHVVEPLVLEPAYDVAIPSPVVLEQQLVDSAQQRLDRLAQNLGTEEPACWVKTGSTKSEILETAKKEGVDLIVVGSHGRHGLGLLLGSTADAVLHSAPCDVLAVRVKA